MEHVQKSTEIFDRSSCKKYIVPTAKSKFVHGGAIVWLRDYDDRHGCIEDNIYIDSTLQEVFADRSLKLKRSCLFSVVLVRGDGIFYWFSQVLLLSLVSWDGVAESAEELAFVQYLEVTPSVNELKEYYISFLSDDEQMQK